MLTEERRAEFHREVADHKLKADGSKSDGPVRVVGILLMIGGAIGAFVAYNASGSQSDTRDILSSLILAVAFLGLIGIGAAMYVATAISRVLRLWLLRQLVEGQAQTDQIDAALRERA
ncbi:MAG TPA: hypothetical protein VMF51_25150 [Nocardioides sp.]|jgi:hypothetical protein|uniref:hypothetical protein n=1 Tax=Nocardioides sp. TaxID=35761 RepID=UPI002C5B93FD|nr:hypothetical protein [Nocardioides sp.]HTW18437.1 hypothetical protein [Nocardioides sp.]